MARNRERKEARASRECPGHYFPVLESFPFENTQADIGSEEDHDALKVEGDLGLGILVFPQKTFDMLKVVFERIDLVHNPVVVGTK